MREPIVFPDVEALLVAALATLLGVDVVQTVPSDRTNADTFLRVVRLGGSSHDHVVDVPTVSFEAWAPGRTAAHALIQEARAYLHALVGSMLDDVPVYSVTDLAAPAWQPDPDSHHPRYVYSASVSVRGRVLAGS